MPLWLPHPDATAQTLSLNWPLPPSSGLKIQKVEFQAAKFSAKHSKLLCSFNHMILPFKERQKQNQFPTQHYLLKPFTSSSNSQGLGDYSAGF